MQPVESSGETKSMYKEVVLGGDVWDLLDEIMIYMNNPMDYYEKQVAFVRVIHFIFFCYLYLVSLFFVDYI